MTHWFRLYDELLDDPKVQCLDPEDFKNWINLLCVASRNGGKIGNVSETAFALRMSEDGALTVLERLCQRCLIDKVSGGTDGWHYAPHAWGKRQYKSDTSTERVKRFRNRSKPLHETAPDTDTEQSILLSKDNSRNGDPEKEFWDKAKDHLRQKMKGDPGSLIGKWLRDHGKEMTTAALSASQLERAVDPRAYIEGYFRRQKSKAQEEDFPWPV